MFHWISLTLEDVFLVLNADELGALLTAGGLYTDEAKVAYPVQSFMLDLASGESVESIISKQELQSVKDSILYASKIAQGIISDTTAEVREAISNNQNNDLAHNESLIPQSLRQDSLAIIRCRLLLRFDLAVSEDRKLACEKAHAKLEKIANGDYLVAPDDGEITPPISSIPEVISPIPTYNTGPGIFNQPSNPFLSSRRFH